MVVSLLSISLLACGSDLTDTSWRADAVYADDGTQVPIPSDSDITFAEDVLVGFAGCNRFRASYTMSEGEIEVGSIVTTKVLCDEQTMEHERNFLQTLRSPHYYEVQDSSLVIMNAHGDVIATFSELAQSTQPQTTAPMPTDYEDSMLQPDNV